ncbi:PulJ/GspJ family protein [Hyphobacterium sp.]|uniref:PulJ/GspJ family protein n=1 Tax=Hyphobacterium sp. TaxID=2004662 RepID=UPI003BAB9536
MSSTKRGFTLVETVIAMALASAGLAAVYQVYASAARAEQGASQAEAAAAIMENLMLTIDDNASGQTENFDWTVEIAPSAELDQLEIITIRLTTETGRNFELRYERARAEAPQ